MLTRLLLLFGLAAGCVDGVRAQQHQAAVSTTADTLLADSLSHGFGSRAETTALQAVAAALIDYVKTFRSCVCRETMAIRPECVPPAADKPLP